MPVEARKIKNNDDI